MARLAVSANVKATGSGTTLAYEPDGTAAARASVDPAQTVTDLATTVTDLDLVATTASTGLVALLNTAGGGPLTYSTATHQYSGNAGTSSTISQSNGNALITLINTMATALLAAQADAVAAKGNGPFDVVVDVNLANVTSLSRLRQLVNALLVKFQGIIAA